MFIHTLSHNFFTMQQQTFFNSRVLKGLLSGIAFVALFLFVNVSSATAQTFVSIAEAQTRIDTKLNQLAKAINPAQGVSLSQVQLERKQLMYKTILTYLPQVSDVGFSIKLGIRTAYGPKLGVEPGMEPTKQEMEISEAEATTFLSK